MEVFRKVFAAMSTGTPIHTDTADVVSAQTDLGKLTVSREFVLDVETLLPTVNYSIFLDDVKVNGYNGDFLTSEEIAEINLNFAKQNGDYIHYRETNAKNKRAFFNENFGTSYD